MILSSKARFCIGHPELFVSYLVMHFKTKAEKAEKGVRPGYDVAGKGMEAYGRAAGPFERVGERKEANGVAIA